MFHVRILSIPGCPSASQTVELVESSAKELGITLELEVVVVSNPEEAVAQRLIGSPTVQVNGVDIEAVEGSDKHFSFG